VFVAAPPREGATQGAAVCNGTPDVQFHGVYDSVVLDGCAHVILDHVKAATLVMRKSSANVIDSSFAKGVSLDGSELVMTAGRIGGDVGVDVKGSKLDLAGVAIEATQRACQVSGDSRVLFSVCPVQIGQLVVWRHGAGGCELAPKTGS
jgi:hypothetical protein